MIECEHIVVRAFQSQHQTCSFRASKLPETFYSTKAELERQKLASSLASEQSRPATQGRQLMGESGTRVGSLFQAGKRSEKKSEFIRR